VGCFGACTKPPFCDKRFGSQAANINVLFFHNFSHVSVEELQEFLFSRREAKRTSVHGVFID
jgi:serine kinase of HPr protein (carbohydrate metabolism regulator)